MKHLQVETTSVCNAYCVFCPHDRIVAGHMDKDLYEKIVIDAGQYDLVTFSPVMTGEPFCDPDIMERLRFARKILKPATTIILFTNGSLITEANIDELAEIYNLEFVVSLNGARASTRERLMGLSDFDKVAATIYHMKEKGMQVSTSMVWFPTVTAPEATTFSSFPNPYAIRFQSFAGHIYRYKRVNGTCRRAEEYLTVLRSGQVCLCCFDAFGELVFGDLNKQTIAEVLEGRERNEYLKASHEGKINELKLCRQCTEGD